MRPTLQHGRAVVLVDPIPIVPPLRRSRAWRTTVPKRLGYDDISGYGPSCTNGTETLGNATQAPGAWTVQFDSTFSFVDGSGQLAFETLVDLSITDQCGKTLLHTILSCTLLPRKPRLSLGSD